jgi:hypothetical protein
MYLAVIMETYDEDRAYKRRVRQEENRLKRNKQLLRDYTLLAIVVLSVILMITGL